MSENKVYEKMKKVYFIQQHTATVTIAGGCQQLATDYIILDGYVSVKNESWVNPWDIPVYKFDGSGETNMEHNNFIPGAFFDTYDEALKALTQLLAVRCSNDIKISEKFYELVDKYPEYAI